MKIPEEIIERIRDSLDIEEVVGEVVPLKKSGTHFFGLCPFHSEKSPSFSVHPSRGRYHCFGCGADGDAIEFVRQTRGLDFMEAIEALAQRAGVKLPETQEMSSQEKARMQHQAAMRGVLSEVQAHYHRALVDRLEKTAQAPDGSPGVPGDPVVAYCQKRGLTLEVVRRFGLGWAENGATVSLLKGREQLGVSAGVLSEREEDPRGDHRTAPHANRWRDRLRDRLTFPIADDQGRVIAFGGRIIASDVDAPKYLNTPETELYKKCEALYRIHDARASIHKHKRAIVVEGYMDALSLAAAGVDEVVACCGTAMTDFHLKKLLKWSDEIVMLFDGDQAGAKASARTSKICLQYFQAGKHFRFVQIPDEQDPDDLVRGKGVGALRSLIDNSPELSDYLLSSTAHRHRSLRSIEDKSAFLQDIRSQIKEAGLPESPFTSLLFKQAYRMAYGDEPKSMHSRPTMHSGPRTPGSPGPAGHWRDRWKVDGGVPSRGIGRMNAPPLKTAVSFWGQMLEAIHKAPTMASTMTDQLIPLLDLENAIEAKIADLLKTLQADHIEVNTPDHALSADFLLSSPKLIIKRRRDDAIEALGKLRSEGQISETEYLESTMKILSVS